MTPERADKAPEQVPWNPSRAKSFSYVDPRTQITFYVESDGRHLAAIDSSGKLMWVRNPFEDSELCPYRSPRPVIDELKTVEVTKDEPNYLNKRTGRQFRSLGMADPSHKFLKLTFDSSQFGLLDESTGDFLELGNN
jgi:hypothetical protein